LIKTSAIVIWVLKYGDSSLIVNCYTKSDGLKSYFLNGILKAKKSNSSKGLFQTFNLINIVSNHRKKEGLNYIKEANVYAPINSIHTSIVKTSVILFLSEVLKSVLKEEGGENENLFSFLETTILWLENNDPTPNFHIKFLIELTKYIGFYPNKSNINYIYFDLTSGCFTRQNKSKHILSIENTKSFKDILGMTFDQIYMLKWNTNTRNSLLDGIICYYRLHLQSFKTPKSLSVLHEVFK
tara:strand:- start:2754 stop:3473 length:720 start_codon:yes stop_codon:yes gene_type:complete